MALAHTISAETHSNANEKREVFKTSARLVYIQEPALNTQ